ncbi:hypothetical protein BT93_G0615 [Corymbia citriodora subsp. variegata]|nr:hypothetical protein BT93_G0615 [Corymbia citriodora subsp. variegata]
MEALELEREPASDAVHGDRTPQPSPEPTKEKEQEKPIVSFFGLFVAADEMDYVLMFFGSAGVCIFGAALTVFFVLLSWMIDSLRKLSSDPHGLSSRVSEDALHLVHLGLILFASAWIGF